MPQMLYKTNPPLISPIMTAQHNSIALEKAIRGESMYSNKNNSHVMIQPHGVSSNVKIIKTNNETIDMTEDGNCPALHL